MTGQEHILWLFKFGPCLATFVAEARTSKKLGWRCMVFVGVMSFASLSECGITVTSRVFGGFLWILIDSLFGEFKTEIGEFVLGKIGVLSGFDGML